MYLARGNADRALGFATEGAARQPLNLQANIVLARALVAAQQLETAQQVIETIERSSLPLASIHTTRAMFELARQRPAAAGLAVERALAIAPADIEALSLLTKLDARPGSAAAAVAAAAAQPQATPELMLLAARTQAANGDTKAAEKLARQVLAAQPSSAAAYQLLGEIYASAGRLDDARHEFERILQLQPASVMAHTMVGILLQMQNRPADAERAYEAAVQADARGAGVAANNLAWLIAERNGNLDLALQHAQSAVAALRDSAGPKDTLGWIYYRKGMPERAVAALKEAVAQEPGSARYHYHLGLACAAAGDSTQARQALERALALQPDFAGSADARAGAGPSAGRAIVGRHADEECREEDLFIRLSKIPSKNGPALWPTPCTASVT